MNYFYNVTVYSTMFNFNSDICLVHFYAVYIVHFYANIFETAET